MPILVVEGANKVGKSTFIEALKKVCEYKEIPLHLVSRRVAKNAEVEVTPEQMYKVAMEDINEALEFDAKGYLVVFDRFHISELVYGKVYRDYHNGYMWTVNRILTAVDAKILLLLSSYEHLTDANEKLRLKSLQQEFTECALALSIDCKIQTIKLESVDSVYLKETAEEVLEAL